MATPEYRHDVDPEYDVSSDLAIFGRRVFQAVLLAILLVGLSSW